MDKVVRKTLSEALAKLTDATFAFETVAHLRGMERELIPITDLLRIQQIALARIVDGTGEARDRGSEEAIDQPITRKLFVEELVEELGRFSGGVEIRLAKKSFEDWFKQFEGDVFAPAGP